MLGDDTNSRTPQKSLAPKASIAFQWRTGPSGDSVGFVGLGRESFRFFQDHFTHPKNGTFSGERAKLIGFAPITRRS